jgi:hypothetical protein
MTGLTAGRIYLDFTGLLRRLDYNLTSHNYNYKK